MLRNLLNRFASSPPSASAPALTPAPAADPALSDQLVAQGNALEDAGDLAGAEAAYRQAIAAAPRSARAPLNLGIVLAARGDDAGATAAYEAALALEPAHPFANYNFARLVYMRGDAARAEALLREALRGKPAFPQALVLLASVLDELGRTDEAIEAVEAALRLQPEDAGAWYNLGVMLRRARRHAQAEEAARRAFALDGRTQALELTSVLLRDQGFTAQALEPLRAAIAAEPDALGHRSSEAMILNFVDDVDARELFERHADYGRRLERAVPVRFEHRPADADPRRRLRVGYVSGDLCTHPVSLFLLPVLERHDRAAVEVFCYSSGRSADHVTQRLRQLAEHWVDARDMTDSQLADAIHADAIDVLVDLTGHTQHSRLGTFSQRPAPVQATWLGYLNTTGLTRMDYRICDRRTDPVELSQPLHTERLAHLPESQWCYRPFIELPLTPAAPVEANGHVTFGSFNNAPKITDAMCRRWGQVLARTPGSRLLVADVASERKRAAILAEVGRAGVEAGRVDFMPRVSLDEYFEAIARVDIALDTFPYGGGTTTFDALWTGVPVVAARGPTPVSRSAASLLEALGLDDWIAPTIEDLVDVAVRRAADHATIATLRRTLRRRLQDSPLTDEARFVRDLEALYRRMRAEARG